MPINVESGARRSRSSRRTAASSASSCSAWQRAARHRARHRPGARRDAARQDHRLRRQPHRTHGAFGALAFGIGTTEVGHVLATQCLLQRRPKTLAIEVTGELRAGVTAKDLILAIIGKIGVSGGTGHVIEYRGAAIERCRWKSA